MPCKSSCVFQVIHSKKFAKAPSPPNARDDLRKVQCIRLIEKQSPDIDSRAYIRKTKPRCGGGLLVIHRASGSERKPLDLRVASTACYVLTQLPQVRLYNSRGSSETTSWSPSHSCVLRRGFVSALLVSPCTTCVVGMRRTV